MAAKYHQVKYPKMLKLTIKRKEAGLKIYELAEKTGLNYNTISQYENGKHRPLAENLQKIADALGCEVKDIV